MSGKTRVYEGWIERIISKEKDRRVIHYYLASTSAKPLLAVVGKEKNDRHYIYVVSEEFLEAFGSSPVINSHTKWTSRKDVMEWLMSLVRKDDLPPTNSNLHNVPTHESNGSLDAIGASEPSAGNGSLDAIATSEPSGVQLLEPAANEQASFQVGDNLELLCQDHDMRGCWYRCKIMEISKRFWKVQYNDMKNEEGSGNLEQYVPPPRLAPPDKLSMRHSGRLTIRPCPPEEEPPTTFEVGAAVDAWWSDGWWEGLVSTGVSLSSSDNYHVFLPGPGRFLILHRKDLRASREWVDDTWVPIKSHPDILSFLCSYFK